MGMKCRRRRRRTIRNNLLGTWKRRVLKYLWGAGERLPLFKGYGLDQKSRTRGGPNSGQGFNRRTSSGLPSLYRPDPSHPPRNRFTPARQWTFPIIVNPLQPVTDSVGDALTAICLGFILDRLVDQFVLLPFTSHTGLALPSSAT